MGSVSMVSILNAHKITTLLDVIGATEFGVHLLEHNVLGLGNEEIHEDSQEDIDASEHVERVEATVLS